MTTTEDEQARRRRVHVLISRPSSSGRLRFLVALGAGVVVAVVLSLLAVPRFGIVVGLMVTSAIYVTWTYAALRPFGGLATKRHSSKEDTGATLSTVGAAAVVAASLGAVINLLVQGHSSQYQDVDALTALGGVLFAWFLLHTLYVSRYASLYYADDTDPGTPTNPQPTPFPDVPDEPPVVAGIDFNSSGYWPTYADFTYFAFNLGMTFQVSDTSVSDPRIRRLVLQHCLLSYFFATAITATVINLVVGLVS